MKTTIKEITPQWAARILDRRNPNNRNISEKYVERLATDIANGAYLQTHQAIAFDDNGDLIDGQHRLMAVVRANLPIRSVVVDGVPAAQKLNGTLIKTFSVIDTGRARRSSQMLKMEGYKYTTSLAAISRMLYQICGQEPEKYIAISVPTVKLVLCACKGSVEEMAGTWYSGKILRPNTAFLAAITFWHTFEPDLATEFCAELGDVSGSKDSVSRQLAAWASKNLRVGGRDSYRQFAAASNAISQARSGRNLGRIYPSPESIKSLLGLNPALKNKIASFQSHYTA